MRIYCSRCHTVEYTATITATDPGAAEFEPGSLSSTTVFSDCLLVRVGMERGDIVLADTAAEIVYRIALEADAAITVIDGFAHCSAAWTAVREYPPSPAIETDALSHLAKRLREDGIHVHLVPFGWSKSWDADPLDDPGSQHVIDLAIGNEAVVWSAADIGGWNSHCGLLFRP
ncbi:threonyl-tRNA synthetase editing domain-containing protein [Nocardia sp. NPDC005998]|uniref:threonyl-tRNA synthetase editing domain-containing protein n=1 Tax=Nocardia sp. NPDC005998 TaxID=3156894 RepID=UPI0033B512D6